MRNKLIIFLLLPLFLNGATWSLTVMEGTPPTINSTINSQTQTLLDKLSKTNEDYKNQIQAEMTKKLTLVNAVRNLEKEILVELKNVTFNKEIMIRMNATPMPTGAEK